MLGLVVTALCAAAAATAATHPTRPPGWTPKPTPVPMDLKTTLANMGNYTTITSLLQSAGLLDTLNAAGNVTLFLPTDAAMARVPQDTLNDLQANPDKLKNLLGYHAVVGRAKKISNNNNDLTLNSTIGQNIRINVYGKPIGVHTAEGVKIVQEDIHVTNGWVHGIDGIMMPPTGHAEEVVCMKPELSTFCSLLNTSGVVGRLVHDRSLTVFAPANDAFNKLPQETLNWLTSVNGTRDLKEILNYHLVQNTTFYSAGIRHSMTFESSDHAHDVLMLLEDYSGGVSINNAKISQVDVSASNGVIHVIDDVLIPTKTLIRIENKGGVPVIG